MAKIDPDEAASPADKESNPPAEKKAAKASPDKAPKPAAGKPVKPSADKPAKPPAAKAPAPTGVRPGKPAAQKAPVPAPERETEAEQEEKPTEEEGVQTAPAPKAKKKAKAETGIAAKPGLASFFSFRKAEPAGVWGVDLGQCALKAVRLEVIDGEVAATAFDYVEHPKILSQPDADPDELTREALAKFLSRNVLRGDTVAISVPGQSGLARFVKLPPVEEKKIPDIVKFEAKQQIPFNLEEVVWDYQKLGVNELAPGFVETEIGLFAMKRDMVTRYLQHFKDVGVEVHLVQMAPLALCNFVAYDLLGREAGAPEEPAKGKKRCITALDIGADSSNLVITDGARIIWQRPIPLGGNHFTRALTKDLKLTFAKAEHLKRNAVKSPDLKQILASLKPVLTDFVGEVQRSLGYFTNTHRDAQIEYMVGLGNAFRLPGLQRFLAEKLQMDVRKLGKMERLTGDDVVTSATYTENILSFAVAYGLALQGLRKTKLQTNLLPSEIRDERAVRGKKPWVAASAALLMLGLGAYSYALWCPYHSWTDEKLAAAETTATQKAGEAKSAQDKFDSTKAAALKEEEAVKSIIAGQMERKDWLELTRFLFSDAIPHPDGKNLSETAQKKYGEKGEQAFKNLEDRQKGLGSGPKDDASPPKDAVPGAKTSTSADDLPAGVDDLIQFNIEYFDQRYTDDLGEAWKQIKDKNHVFSASDIDALRTNVKSADPTTPPDGKGWVVELQGYTYHSNGPTFIRDTLMDNLYRLSVKDAPAAPAAPVGTPPVAGTPTSTPPAAATEPHSDKDAYLNHISHVVLFDANDPSTSGRGSIVGQSVLDTVVKSAAGDQNGMAGAGGTGMAPSSAGSGSGAAPAPPGTPAPGGSGAAGGSPAAGPAAAVSRDGWKPLSSLTGGSASGAPSAPGAFTPDSSKARPAATPPGHTRTEFVVFFVWKEPTPSDSLRGEDAAPAKPATTGAAGASPTMAPPTMAAPPPPAVQQPGGGH